MKCYYQIDKDLYYIGSSHRGPELFEGVFPVPEGVSYNSFLLLDEKTVLFDCTDPLVQNTFFDNLEALLGERDLDFIVVNHVEPDHSGTLKIVLKLHPEATIVTNFRAVNILKKFGIISEKTKIRVIDDASEFSSGKHSFSFFNAPMVHWPEVMFTFDKTNRTLFTADAFGSFGSLDGYIFADNYNYDKKFKDECRRYYANIVGKYGIQVREVLKNIPVQEVERIFPLHGPLFRKNLHTMFDLYEKWSSYSPEDENDILIVYTSIYGGTANAVNILANTLSQKENCGIKIMNAITTDPSYIVSECFRCGKIVFASTTYNLELFPKMEYVLKELKDHNLSNRKIGLIENGSWAPQAGNKMSAFISSMKNMNLVCPPVTVSSSADAQCEEKIKKLASLI